jgi:tRNA threonylcarbamoyladenosine modification (KEOPS) complex  Pcc1 subunit
MGLTNNSSGRRGYRSCLLHHHTQKHTRSQVSITRQHGRVMVKNNVPDTSHLPHVAASATSSLLILQPIPASLPL